MFIFGQCQFHVESERTCLVKPTGPLVSGCAIEVEVSVIFMRFLVFMQECANNGKLMTCEIRYYFLLFTFIFAADDPIIDKIDNIHGKYTK